MGINDPCHHPVANVIITRIMRLHFTEDRPNPLMARWTKLDRQLLQLALDEGAITKEHVLEVIKERLTIVGKEIYEKQCIGNNTPADHVICPAALAAFMASNTFPEGGEQRIQFDHGDTMESMVRQYRTFPEEIFNQLRLA